MEDVRQSIIRLATKRMNEVGIRSVSIDDIAHEMSISKKTFYVYFATKDELIAAMLTENTRQLYNSLTQATKDKPIVDLLVEGMQIAKRTEGMLQPPTLVYDLRKYYPDLLMQNKLEIKEVLLGVLRNILSRGINEGIFRHELDVEIVAQFFVGLHHALMERMEQKADSKETITRVSRQGMDILMRGIITPEGSEKVKLKMKNV